VPATVQICPEAHSAPVVGDEGDEGVGESPGASAGMSSPQAANNGATIRTVKTPCPRIDPAD
jgi:hypothetical protein